MGGREGRELLGSIVNPSETQGDDGMSHGTWEGHRPITRDMEAGTKPHTECWHQTPIGLEVAAGVGWGKTSAHARVEKEERRENHRTSERFMHRNRGGWRRVGGHCWHSEDPPPKCCHAEKQPWPRRKVKPQKAHSGLETSLHPQGHHQRAARNQSGTSV